MITLHVEGPKGSDRLKSFAGAVEPDKRSHVFPKGFMTFHLQNKSTC